MIKLLVVALFFTSACAKTYPRRLEPVRKHAASYKYEAALSSLEDTNLHESQKNRLLYHFEAGLLYHLAGDYRQSNYFLERAEWISDEMYTRSISAEAVALLTSDMMLPYRGEYFDYLFVNYYKLLNYLYLSDIQGALVEVRRINHKLSLFEKDSAFFHYITAILHDISGNESGAFIEYKKAYEGYSERYSQDLNIPVPEQLKKDIWAFIQKTEFSRRDELPPEAMVPFELPKEYGQAVFLFETNFAPRKIENSIQMQIPSEYKKKYPKKLSGVYYLKVSLPEYEEPDDNIKKVSLNINGSSHSLELTESPGKLALLNFQKIKPTIVARAMARAVAKYVGYRQVRGGEDASEARKALGLLANILGVATERADTRSWLTLPNNIFFARKYLPPGTYTFSADIQLRGGTSKKTEEFEFKIKKGETVFITKRLNY
ncbi:MAG: hypothetical protein ACQESB_03295 [Elusimicrobiota bacterium]